MAASPTVFRQQYFHGTRADLEVGDLVVVGHDSNYDSRRPLSWVYFTSTLDTAIWGAELAAGSAPGRIYIVEATGSIEDDPNVTDKRFPGNPSMSYRSRDPLRIVAEAIGWTGHSPEQIQQMKDGLASLTAQGANVIID